MELSFPCTGNIDDGVFNIDLEECEGDIGDGQQWRAPPPTCDSGDSSLLDPQHNCRPQVLSPDALDLALMAFDVTASEEDDGGNAVSNAARDSTLSPFCDAAIYQRDSAVTRRIRPDEAYNTPSDSIASSALQRATGTKNRCGTPSPGVVPMGWPSAQAHRGEFSKAFPLKLTAVVGDDQPSDSGTRLGREHRVGEVWRRGPGHHPVRRLITDAHAQSRWARERAETREAVALGVRKEEKALAVIDRAAIECLNGMNDGVKIETNSAEIKRAAFVNGVGCGSLSLQSPSPRDAKRGEDRENDISQNGAPAQGKEKDDLLARASELHSSVAGQLRGVNELLKRKSYFYIDTSWSARQLPYPPTAWKSPGMCGPTNEGHGERVGIDAKVTCRITANADRNQSAALSDANGVLRLDGRWVAAGSKKPKVGFYSIPGEKVSMR